MDSLNADWSKEVREFLEARVYELLKKRILAEARKIRSDIRSSYGMFPSSAIIIREDREVEH